MIFILKDDLFIQMPFLYRIGYMWFTACMERMKFYFGWTLSDLVCNASGLGFNGYDENNESKWDLLTNFDLKNIEVFWNFKLP